MTTAHFVIWYSICVFSIFIGSSVILVDIQTGIITTFECYICIRLGGPILSSYSLYFEYQCLIFIYIKIYILVRFVFVSMSRIFIFIIVMAFTLIL